MRKLFTLLLVLLVSVSFSIPGAAEDAAPSAYASGDYEYTVNADGNAVITKYSGQDETVNVPAALDGYPVVGVGDWAFAWCPSLISVNLPDGLISIGYEAFQGCQALSTINFPDSLLTIDIAAFGDCSSLVSINLPDSLLSIQSSAFETCSSLTTINLPDSLQYIGDWAFDSCEALTLIVPRDSYAHEYAEENEIPYQLLDGEHTYGTLYNLPELPNSQVEIPSNGEIHFYSESDTDMAQNEVDPLTKDSLISITVPSGEDYYLVTLADPNTYQKRIVIFIHPGETVDSEIPSGEYQLYYTCGQTWYGFEEKFGPMAARKRSEKINLFEKGYGWSYTLYPVSDGNLSTESVSLEDYPD